MTPPPYDPQRYGYQSQPAHNAFAEVQTIATGAMKRVYLKMTLGLIVTALVALWCTSSPAFWNFLAANNWAIWGLFIGELILVFAISAGINKMSTMTASLLFYLFAAINGAALSPIFMVYTAASISKTFFITAGTFGAMSVYGYFTNKDLTKWGSILIMALFGLIIVSLVNIFLKSSGLEWIISAAGVLIFIGLTAWDTQKIKQMAEYTPASEI